MVGEGPYPPYFILVGDQPKPCEIFPPDFDMRNYKFVCFMNAVLLNDVNAVNKLFEYWGPRFVKRTYYAFSNRKYHFAPLFVDYIDTLSFNMIICLHCHGMITMDLLAFALVHIKCYYDMPDLFWDKMIYCAQLFSSDQLRSRHLCYALYYLEYRSRTFSCVLLIDEINRYIDIHDGALISGAGRFRAFLEKAIADP